MSILQYLLRMKKYILFLVVVTAGLAACQRESEKYHIGILQWTESIEPYRLTYNGILDSLRDKGYREEINLRINYMNAEQDKNHALLLAENFVKEEVDLIVALGTGSSMAALDATENSAIPIVFSIVGAPKSTGLIKDYNRPGRRITGVSMEIPVAEQFKFIGEILPEMKSLGVLYCNEMVQAVATGKEAVEQAERVGWKVQEVVVPKEYLRDLKRLAESLTDTVDAVYIPTDPILNAPENLQIIIEAADRKKTPVLGVAKKFVEKGVLTALHCDFYGIGRQTGDPIIQVLKGVDPQDIPVQKPLLRKLSLNLKKAQELGLTINRNVILRADNIID